MRVLTLASVALLLSAGSVFAVEDSKSSQALDPASPSAQDAPPTGSPSMSGRPSAILTDSECQNVWNEAAQDGDSLKPGQATRYIANFKQADANNDNQISNDEFSKACQNGWVQAGAEQEQKSGAMKDKSGG